MKKQKTASEQALALIRRMVKFFPEVGTDEEINGGDAVEAICAFVQDGRLILRNARKEKKQQR